MTPFLSDYYLWLKIAHLIATFAWMAGLLYLPRLFAYHAMVEPDSEADEVFKKMEHRLLRAVMNPAMLAVFVLGILLIVVTHAGAPGTGGWMHTKILLALIMAGIQGMMSKYRSVFAQGQNTRSDSFYRNLHRVLIVLMVAIVILVVRRPF